jgi:tetratricopeptide (TPR) repeat protein
MTQQFSRARRFVLSAIALLCAAVLFRSEIAEALIIRGDDYLYRGDRASALQHYQRALSAAPWSETAADRYVFVSMERQSIASRRAALSIADRYLRAYPHDAVLLADRGLWYLHAHRYADAQRDFAAAAVAARSVSDYVFAGFAAEHARNRRAARLLWLAALREQPGYKPALIALAEDTR